MRTLPDYLRKGMKLVIVGCNPSESSVRVGHYYAGRVNQFWPVLYKGGVVPEPFDYHDDKRVIEFGIGLTDLVKRPTKTPAELTREDFAEGRIVLSQRLGEFTPHVIAFNGKLAFEQFAQRKCKFGLQKDLLYGARVYVLPETNTQDPQGNSERVPLPRFQAPPRSRTKLPSGRRTRWISSANGHSHSTYSVGSTLP